MQACERDDPDDGGVGDGCGQAQKNGLSDGAANRNDKSRHHGFGMAGLKPVQRAEQNGAWDEKPKILAAGLDEAREIGHKAP